MRPIFLCFAAAGLLSLSAAHADPGLHDLPMDVMDPGETPEQAVARIGGADEEDESSPFAIPPQQERVWSTELRQVQFDTPDLIDAGLPDTSAPELLAPPDLHPGSSHANPPDRATAGGLGSGGSNRDRDRDRDRDDDDRADRERKRDEKDRRNRDRDRDRDRDDKGGDDD